MDLSEGEAIVLEIIAIAGSGRVAHMRELAVRAEFKKFLWNGVVENKIESTSMSEKKNREKNRGLAQTGCHHQSESSHPFRLAGSV
jgi:hypothetical protein